MADSAKSDKLQSDTEDLKLERIEKPETSRECFQESSDNWECRQCSTTASSSSGVPAKRTRLRSDRPTSGYSNRSQIQPSIQSRSTSASVSLSVTNSAGDNDELLHHLFHDSFKGAGDVPYVAGSGNTDSDPDSCKRSSSGSSVRSCYMHPLLYEVHGTGDRALSWSGDNSVLLDLDEPSPTPCPTSKCTSSSSTDYPATPSTPQVIVQRRNAFGDASSSQYRIDLRAENQALDLESDGEDSVRLGCFAAKASDSSEAFASSFREKASKLLKSSIRSSRRVHPSSGGQSSATFSVRCSASSPESVEDMLNKRRHQHTDWSYYRSHPEGRSCGSRMDVSETSGSRESVARIGPRRGWFSRLLDDCGSCVKLC